MKKVLAIVLAALLIVAALVGCAAKSETADTAADSTLQVERNYIQRKWLWQIQKPIQR